MIEANAIGIDALRARLAADRTAFRKGLRRNLVRAVRYLAAEARRQIGMTGIRARSGLLSRSIRGRVYQVADDTLRGQVKGEAVRVGNWIGSRAVRKETAFYWYFLEYGTGPHFTRGYSRRSSSGGNYFRQFGRFRKSGRGLNVRAYGFLAAAAIARRDQVVDVVGESFDVFT
jgi:hypothetical protein